MLQNAKIIAFTISELLRENQQGREGGKITKLPPPSSLPSTIQIRVKQIK